MKYEVDDFIFQYLSTSPTMLVKIKRNQTFRLCRFLAGLKFADFAILVFRSVCLNAGQWLFVVVFFVGSFPSTIYINIAYISFQYMTV